MLDLPISRRYRPPGSLCLVTDAGSTLTGIISITPYYAVKPRHLCPKEKSGLRIRIKRIRSVQMLTHQSGRSICITGL